jgi:hypothetical protein
MCRCKRSRDVDVEVVNDVVAVVVVVMVDVVLVIVGVAAFAGGAKDCAIFCFCFRTELQSWKRHLADVGGCIPGTSCRCQRKPPSAQRFCQNYRKGTLWDGINMDRGGYVD